MPPSGTPPRPVDQQLVRSITPASPLQHVGGGTAAELDASPYGAVLANLGLLYWTTAPSWSSPARYWPYRPRLQDQRPFADQRRQQPECSFSEERHQQLFLSLRRQPPSRRRMPRCPPSAMTAQQMPVRPMLGQSGYRTEKDVNGSRAAALGGSWPATVAFQQSRVCHLLLARIRPILGQSGYRTGMGMYGQPRSCAGR